jgi:hypothetical protein
MSHPDPLSFNDFVSSRSSPPSPTATLIALAAGLYALCYAFAALGYPVRRWAAMSLAAMRSRSPSPAASDDGLLGSLFSLNGDGLISKGMRSRTGCAPPPQNTPSSPQTLRTAPCSTSSQSSTTPQSAASTSGSRASSRT